MEQHRPRPGLTPYRNNETLYWAAVDRLVETGLRDLGYDTVLSPERSAILI